MTRTAALWLLVGTIGYCLLPWYMTDGGFWSSGWLTQITSGNNGTALAHVTGGGVTGGGDGRAGRLRPALAL